MARYSSQEAQAPTFLAYVALEFPFQVKMRGVKHAGDSVKKVGEKWTMERNKITLRFNSL